MAESSSSLGFLATVGMVIGPPFVYADQAYSIARRRNSEGFSKDVCAVLLIANIARIFWWFQVHFEFGGLESIVRRSRCVLYTSIDLHYFLLQHFCCSRSS